MNKLTPGKLKQVAYPKSQVKQADVDRKAYAQAVSLLNDLTQISIDKEIAELEENLEGATGSKYTANVFAQNKLLRLKNTLILSQK